MIDSVPEAKRTQHSQIDYQQWALLSRVRGLRIGPKGHAVGSKLWRRDIKVCLCPLIKHTAGWQQYKPKLNLLYKTGFQISKWLWIKASVKTNNHYNTFLD